MAPPLGPATAAAVVGLAAMGALSPWSRGRSAATSELLAEAQDFEHNATPSRAAPALPLPSSPAACSQVLLVVCCLLCGAAPLTCLQQLRLSWRQFRRSPSRTQARHLMLELEAGKLSLTYRGRTGTQAKAIRQTVEPCTAESAIPVELRIGQLLGTRDLDATMGEVHGAVTQDQESSAEVACDSAEAAAAEHGSEKAMAEKATAEEEPTRLKAPRHHSPCRYAASIPPRGVDTWLQRHQLGIKQNPCGKDSSATRSCRKDSLVARPCRNDSPVGSAAARDSTPSKQTPPRAISPGSTPLVQSPISLDEEGLQQFYIGDFKAQRPVTIPPRGVEQWLQKRRSPHVISSEPRRDGQTEAATDIKRSPTPSRNSKVAYSPLPGRKLALQ